MVSRSGRSSRSTLIGTKCVFINVAISSFSKDSRSITWHQWQAEYPILLSIGYSACHWCHVMERESFENEEIATFMNTHFVPIKVDREERPDLDTIYMQAVQAMTHQGGWPMTMFLTPDGRPFYGGTYFPP